MPYIHTDLMTHTCICISQVHMYVHTDVRTMRCMKIMNELNKNLDCAIGMNFLHCCANIIQSKRMHFLTEKTKTKQTKEKKTMCLITKYFCPIVRLCWSASRSVSQFLGHVSISHAFEHFWMLNPLTENGKTKTKTRYRNEKEDR